MRRHLLAAAVITIGLATAAAPAPAATTCITFRAGAVSATVTGRFRTPDDTASYPLKVRSGQKMTITDSQKISVAVTDPHGNDASAADLSCNSAKRIAPTIGGDYRIRVSPCMKYDNPYGPYRLTVSVIK